LPLARLGLPCANTYRNVCAQLDVAQLNQRLAGCFSGSEAGGADDSALVAAEQQAARHLAVDGKSLCGTQDQGVAAQADQQVVGLYDVGQQVMVRQVPRPGKGQERAAAQQVVVVGLDLAGCVVTADALHTQVQWCQTVLALGGNYLLIARNGSVK
jgi:hypothetical protein